MMRAPMTGGKSEGESIDGGSDEALTGAMAATIGEPEGSTSKGSIGTDVWNICRAIRLFGIDN